MHQVITGVPQHSILGPILFSLFINDISINCQHSTAYLFADHTTRGMLTNMIEDMRIIIKWFRVNRLSFNATETSFMVFDKNPEVEILLIKLPSECWNQNIEEVKSQKYLGSVKNHIDSVKSKIAERIGALYRSKSLLPCKYRKMLVYALMLPQLDNLDII